MRNSVAALVGLFLGLVSACAPTTPAAHDDAIRWDGSTLEYAIALCDGERVVKVDIATSTSEVDSPEDVTDTRGGVSIVSISPGVLDSVKMDSFEIVTRTQRNGVDKLSEFWVEQFADLPPDKNEWINYEGKSQDLADLEPGSCPDDGLW